MKYSKEYEQNLYKIHHQLEDSYEEPRQKPNLRWYTLTVITLVKMISVLAWAILFKWILN